MYRIHFLSFHFPFPYTHTRHKFTPFNEVKRIRVKGKGLLPLFLRRMEYPNNIPDVFYDVYFKDLVTDHTSFVRDGKTTDEDP